MAKAGDMRVCANDRCRVAFAPGDPRQRFHSRACKTAASNALRPRGDARPPRPRTCKQCRVLYRVSELRRFCSHDCRRLYLEKRRVGPRPIAEPVSVLLPLGSSPRRAAINPYAGEMPARKVFCRRYSRCLAYAESKRWPGFSCSECTVNEQSFPNGWEKK